MGGLEERAAELAREARCSRCNRVILEDSAALNTTFLKLRLPGSGLNDTYSLCGSCGISLREFLTTMWSQG